MKDIRRAEPVEPSGSWGTRAAVSAEERCAEECSSKVMVMRAARRAFRPKIPPAGQRPGPAGLRRSGGFRLLPGTGDYACVTFL